MSRVDEPCCGISGEHPYRDRRQCQALRKLKFEVLTHLLMEGPDEGSHAWEPVVAYVEQLEKKLRSRDEEIAVVRAFLEERPAVQGREHEKGQPSGLTAQQRKDECTGQVAARDELAERLRRCRQQDPST